MENERMRCRNGAMLEKGDSERKRVKKDRKRTIKMVSALLTTSVYVFIRCRQGHIYIV